MDAGGLFGFSLLNAIALKVSDGGKPKGRARGFCGLGRGQGRGGHTAHPPRPGRLVRRWYRPGLAAYVLRGLRMTSPSRPDWLLMDLKASA